MSERSERIILTVFIAAKRRCAHWWLATASIVGPSHHSVGHQ